MTYSAITHSRTLAALVIACVMAAFFAQPAMAQTAKKLKCNGCVKSKQLKNGGIKGKDIKDSTVTGSKIADGTLQAIDMGNDAQPGAADFTTQSGTVNLTATATIVRTVTMSLPGPGVVIVNVGGYAIYTASPGSARCAITKGTTVSGAEIVSQGNDVLNARRGAMAGTQGFEEPTGGSQTYNLVCNANVGTAAVDDMVMTAMFFPNRI